MHEYVGCAFNFVGVALIPTCKP